MGPLLVTGNGVTLQLAASNQIADGANLTLQTTSGGPDVVFDLNDQNETLGKLKEDPATIDFGSPTGVSSTLRFADSSSDKDPTNAWAGTLSIRDYQYDFANNASIDHLFFGTDATGITDQ